MKIVIPLSSFGKAGGQRVLSNLASKWVEMGHNVILLVHYTSEPVYFPTKAKIVWIDNHGREMNHQHGHKSTGLVKYFGFFAVLVAIFRGLENYANDADIVLANQSFTTPLPVWISRIGSKKFYYIQGYEPEFIIDINHPSFLINRKIFSNLFLWLLSSTSYFLNLHKIVNSPIYFNYKMLRADKYVPPGIDFSVFYPNDQAPSSDWVDRTITIGCIGRKEVWKGTKHVLDAFNILKQQNFNIRLLVAYGNLPETRDILSDCHIVVPRNDMELADFYRSLDIMIAPGSVQLGAAHYPVMEAIACGVPVITTGYLPARIEGENAWIVPIEDAESIAKAVKEIITDSALRKIRVMNATRDIQEFSWDIVSRKMIDLFSLCLHDSQS